ncbi:MAG: hypothetical protein A2700_02340 [Candidatus Blackburnbacteria bacterium RIFCSPHIGHO2_01_FULL_44_64]|uniref:Uncharacterized protein n=1 Tax=Candidatus Blackburnbacteria bacterium RIFCSPHIGHO2_02_FULL_44_20 TaxID=1797516 RepID=A0A1G1V506_9BACT|nr:MAG: hypothetical protein A2700_02340 [Candidatus Blackburnbacteria bacterium RIFCSPHIGHO2_01_FULL_44_64]OGY10455.1 MAG: hypothetical protein A3D26_04355 [Candidatus Blackburnbacteria bacterium RIFCSPHIGHO2_02_FULL_44_20]OGY10691.1 MAG: hypothetical protein A3E16_01765 [Candidatus Blackburnbacteria bacterium RIFCSPHIGHO2_12_FULL_44_25]OGY13385.1 MAG: hypothetical protein A3A62_01090 [Candidatus Blackburnbacteria bacterium RIFCSPLOWO2_01_FULL_44_43]OGY15939.1 MAG: hypothetical protein A3H88_0
MPSRRELGQLLGIGASSVAEAFLLSRCAPPPTNSPRESSPPDKRGTALVPSPTPELIQSLDKPLGSMWSVRAGKEAVGLSNLHAQANMPRGGLFAVSEGLVFYQDPSGISRAFDPRRSGNQERVVLWKSEPGAKVLAADKDRFAVLEPAGNKIALINAKTRRQTGAISANPQLSPEQQKKHFNEAHFIGDHLIVTHNEGPLGFSKGFSVYTKDGERRWTSPEDHFTLLEATSNTLVAGNQDQLIPFDFATGEKLGSIPALRTGQDQWAYARNGDVIVTIVKGEKHPIENAVEQHLWVYDLAHRRAVRAKFTTGKYDITSSGRGVVYACRTYCDQTFNQITLTPRSDPTIDHREGQFFEIYVRTDIEPKQSGYNHGYTQYLFDPKTGELELIDYPFFTQKQPLMVESDGEVYLRRHEDNLTVFPHNARSYERFNNSDFRRQLIINVDGKNLIYPDFSDTGYKLIGRFGNRVIIGNWGPGTRPQEYKLYGLTIDGKTRWEKSLRNIQVYPIKREGKLFLVSSESIVQVDPETANLTPIATVGSPIKRVVDAPPYTFVETTDNQIIAYSLS